MANTKLPNEKLPLKDPFVIMGILAFIPAFCYLLFIYLTASKIGSYSPQSFKEGLNQCGRAFQNDLKKKGEPSFGPVKIVVVGLEREKENQQLMTTYLERYYEKFFPFFSLAPSSGSSSKTTAEWIFQFQDNWNKKFILKTMRLKGVSWLEYTNTKKFPYLPEMVSWKCSNGLCSQEVCGSEGFCFYHYHPCFNCPLRIAKNKKHCPQHYYKCSQNECERRLSQEDSYCSLHCCSYQTCFRQKRKGGYCSFHKFRCLAQCSKRLSQSGFCDEHRCLNNGCSHPRKKKGYCLNHQFACLSPSCYERFAQNKKYCKDHCSLRLVSSFTLSKNWTGPITNFSLSPSRDYIYFVHRHKPQIYSIAKEKVVLQLPRTEHVTPNLFWLSNGDFCFLEEGSQRTNWTLYSSLKSKSSGGVWAQKIRGVFYWKGSICFLFREDGKSQIYHEPNHTYDYPFSIVSYAVNDKFYAVDSNGKSWKSSHLKSFSKQPSFFPSLYLRSFSDVVLSYGKKGKIFLFGNSKPIFLHQVKNPPSYHTYCAWFELAEIDHHKVILWIENNKIYYKFYSPNSEAKILYENSDEYETLSHLFVRKNQLFVFSYFAEEKLILKTHLEIAEKHNFECD